MMLVIKQFMVCTLVLFVCAQAQAGERLNYDQFKIYADTANLSFEELSILEEKGEIQFGKFEGLSLEVKYYWVKIDSSVFHKSNYIFFSNFFDRIETYHLGNNNTHSISGTLVEFEDRTYKKGFYRHVVLLKEREKFIYIKLISETGNSIFNRSLSHVEISTISDLEKQSSLIFTSFALLTGMELVIILINVCLVFLKPSKTGYYYVFFIVSGILLANFTTQIFVDLLNLPAIFIHYTSMSVGVLIVYSFALFSAYFLNRLDISKKIQSILISPFIPLATLATTYISNGYYFPLISTAYFLVALTFIMYLLFHSWKRDRQKANTYILANGITIFAGLLMLLALNGFFAHHFITTNAIFLGFILRDTIFTFDLLKNYFKLETDSVVRKATIIKLTEEKEQLKRIEVLKTTFFNNVSHELRTPLTLILSPLESSLKSGKVPKELEKELNLSLKNGKYLLQLVNEMLDLGKLDKGELDLIRQPTDIVQVIKKIRDTFQPYAKEIGQVIYLSQANDNITASIDQDKFEKIVINLISNAIKYSDKPGSIYIKVFEEEAELSIHIKDESRGISTQDLPQIFDRYFQSEQISPEEGTGIGLSIVKEFMELHGGSVDCISELGNGSTFRLSFPKSIQKSKILDFKSDEIIIHDPSKFTLLIVEDHTDMRTYLKDKLSDYNIIEVENGKEALKKLKDGLLPDLILTDYMMPSMDGYELVTEIKKKANWVNIPIIFLTARTLTADKVKS